MMWLALALALVAAGVGRPMAYVLVYEQDFGAGNSTFSQTATYYYDGHGSPSASGPDALYPEMWEAETVKVTAGQGPAGENIVEHYAAGGGDYGTSYIATRQPNVTDYATGISIPEGAAEITYRVTATSYAELDGYVVHALTINQGYIEVQIVRTGNANTHLGGSGTSWRYNLRWNSWDTGDTWSDSYTFTNASVQDAWKTVRIEWKRTTFTGGVPDNNGYLRAYLGGTLIYDLTNIDLTYTNDNNFLVQDFQTFGGLWGEMTNLRLYTIGSNGSITVSKTTTPSSDPTEFYFTTTGLGSPDSFTLAHGESTTFSDLTPGSGYGIAETTPSGWAASYSVSNDSPVTNITVGSGESVTVTVTNTQAIEANPEGCPTCGTAPCTVPDPVGPLPPWDKNCADGGIVDSVSDLTDGEDWAA